VLYNDLDATGKLIDKSYSIYLRDIVHERMKVLNTSVAIYAIASILIILHLLQTLSSILIAKYDNLLKK